jgi:epoxyqueuosine reductase QueG
MFDGLNNRSPCCQINHVPVSNLEPREREFLNCFMVDAISAIVVSHHVSTIMEWTWYRQGNHERCDADDHTHDVCLFIKDRLLESGFKSKIVPYPGRSGLQFRSVAHSARVGTIGKSAFLLHPSWGPWTHLRVMATSTRLPDDTPEDIMQKDVCGDCTSCRDRCPAGALDNGFDGLLCKSFRREKGEYDPTGSDGRLNYCLICALACPIGIKSKYARDDRGLS